MKFCLMNNSEFDLYKDKLFEIIYSNMNDLSPTGYRKDEDFNLWSKYLKEAICKNTNILLIKNKHELIGYLQYRIVDDTLFIDEIEIVKLFQQKGIFSSSLRYLISILPKNITFVDAYVNKKNTQSRNVFEHWDFEIVSENKSGSSYLYRGNCSYLLEKYKD